MSQDIELATQLDKEAAKLLRSVRRATSRVATDKAQELLAEVIQGAEQIKVTAIKLRSDISEKPERPTRAKRKLISRESLGVKAIRNIVKRGGIVL
jgi:hypothetical protein